MKPVASRRWGVVNFQFHPTQKRYLPGDSLGE